MTMTQHYYRMYMFVATWFSLAQKENNDLVALSGFPVAQACQLSVKDYRIMQ